MSQYLGAQQLTDPNPCLLSPIRHTLTLAPEDRPHIYLFCISTQCQRQTRTKKVQKQQQTLECTAWDGVRWHCGKGSVYLANLLSK